MNTILAGSAGQDINSIGPVEVEEEVVVVEEVEEVEEVDHQRPPLRGTLMIGTEEQS